MDVAYGENCHSDRERVIGKGRAIRPPRPFRQSVRSRLDAHTVVDGVAELLLAPEVALRGLDSHMHKKESDLIEFATGKMAKSRANASKVMRSELLNACP